MRLRLRVEQVVDVSDERALKPFAEVIRTFLLPRTVSLLARKLTLRRPPWLIRSAVTLQRRLIHPDWRILPVQFGLPANSQVFGRLASGAGLQGILFPSSRKDGKRCLALFPQNWKGSSSFVEIMDPAPREARLTRIDGTTNPLA